MHRIYHRGFTPKSDHVNGIFDLECSPARIAKGMYRQCATACKEVYGVAPTYVWSCVRVWLARDILIWWPSVLLKNQRSFIDSIHERTLKAECTFSLPVIFPAVSFFITCHMAKL